MQRRKIAIGVAALLLTLCGCIGPLVPVTPLDEPSSTALEQSTPVFEPGAAPRGVVNLGAISALSCKNKIWDPPPSRENALAQLRHHARAKGGNAVGDVTCGGVEPTNLLTNCWSSMSCTGSALRAPI